VTEREWILLNPGPANGVSNMGTLTPRDMHGVVEAFGAALAELRAGGGR